MNAEQKMVQDFHEKFGHVVAKGPSWPEEKVRVLREKLMQEELSEVIDAMHNHTIVEVAKELADLLYVVYGTAVVYGIDMAPVFREVHLSNMSKSTEKNEYGKTMKGSDYRPADVETIIYNQVELVYIHEHMHNQLPSLQ